MTAGVPSASAVVSAFQSIRLHVLEIKFRFMFSVGSTFMD